MWHCLVDAVFIAENVSYYGNCFLPRDFVIYLCCGYVALVLWACSQLMGLLTPLLPPAPRIHFCPLRTARVLRSAVLPACCAPPFLLPSEQSWEWASTAFFHSTSVCLSANCADFPNSNNKPKPKHIKMKFSLDLGIFSRYKRLWSPCKVSDFLKAYSIPRSQTSKFNGAV